MVARQINAEHRCVVFRVGIDLLHFAYSKLKNISFFKS